MWVLSEVKFTLIDSAPSAFMVERVIAAIYVIDPTGVGIETLVRKSTDSTSADSEDRRL